MGSSSDSDSSDSVEGAFEKERRHANEWKEQEKTHLDKDCNDACATLEWSQFMKSTAGVLQYMEGAKAESLELCSLVPHSPHQKHKIHDSNTVEETENEQGHTPASSSGVPVSSGSRATQSESIPTVPPRLHSMTTNLTILTESSEAPHQSVRMKAAEICVQRDGKHGGFEGPHGSSSAEALAVETPQPAIYGRITGAVRAGIPTPSAALLDRLPTECSPPRVSSAPTSPGGKNGPEPRSSTTSFSQAFNERDVRFVAGPAMESLTSTASEYVFGDPFLQKTPISLVNAGGGNRLRVAGCEPELPRDVLPFEASRTYSRQQGVALAEQVKDECARTQDGMPVIADAGSQIDVVASVGEAEVKRRIAREKARCVEARQQRREDSIRK